MVRWLSGEWLLSNRPNGGTVVVLRAAWVAALGYAAAVGFKELLRPDAAWSFSATALKAALLENLNVGGAIFAASYAAFYARFASQWSYLAGVYNQIMSAKVRGIGADAEPQSALAAWQAGFIEDAEDLHLATKPMFAGVIISMLGDEGDPVRAQFIEGTAGGAERLAALELRVREAFARGEERHTRFRK